MTDLWLPGGEVDQRHRADAERDRLTDHEVARQLETVRRFNRELRRLDEYLELVWVTRPRDPAVRPLPGMIWERWHVRRRNPDAPDTYLALTAPDGSYVEPSSRVFSMLAEHDLWRGDVQRRDRERRAREAADRERARDAAREERLEEFQLRYKAAVSPGVLFSPDVGWRARKQRSGA